MRFTFTVLLLLAMSSFNATSHAAEPATENFLRGINLSHWYAQSSRGYEEGHLSRYITEPDAKLIADMGFDHVRLTLDNAPFFDPENPGTLKAEPLERFLQRVQMFLDAGVNVIIDLHPGSGYKESLNNAEQADAFVADWRALAEATKDLDQSRVWLEVMNEPSGIDVAYWRELQKRAVEAIREVDPDRTVVVSGGSWTNPDTLFGDGEDSEGFKPYDIENLVYTFHFYDPHLWTHQGASWGWEIATRVNGVPWPVDPADAEKVAREVTEDEEAFGHTRRLISAGQFTEEFAIKLLDAVKAWQEKHDVPVYVGEFGVYTKNAPEESRYRWTEFVVDAFEERGWGWAIWDYAGGFRVATGDPGERQADDRMLEALGLKE